jgi:hypothetical protein
MYQKQNGAAVMPVLSALVILVAVTCIFAIFAVHLFGHADAWNFGADVHHDILTFHIMLYALDFSFPKMTGILARS